MKTKEFIKKVEELGFETSTHENTIALYNKGNEIAFVYRRLYMKFKNSYADWDDLSIGDKKNLFGLIVEYVSTPVDEREEEKTFILRHLRIKWKGFNQYLSKNINDGVASYELDLFSVNGRSHLDFTVKEMEEIKEKYNTDLSDFEIVEVEEWTLRKFFYV